MESEATHGLAKLTKKGFPVSFNPFKNQLAEAREELAKLEKSRAVPGKRVSLKRLAFLFKPTTLPDGPIQRKIETIQKFIKDLEGRQIEGVLVPLTEAEHLECQAQLVSNLNTLRKTFDWEGISKEQKEAQDQAIEMVSSMSMVSKWMECSLKKKDKVDGSWVRYWDRGANKTIEPAILKELFVTYQMEFSLTEEEKKN